MNRTLSYIISLVYGWVMVMYGLKPVYAALENEVVTAGRLKIHETASDHRVEKIEFYLAEFESDLVDFSGHLVREADRLSLDWRLVTAIAGLESSYCKRIPENSFNCWGWGIPTGASTGLSFSSYADGITVVSEGLRSHYLNRGLSTVEEIGRIYAASPTWAVRVRNLMDKIENYDPDPVRKVKFTI